MKKILIHNLIFLLFLSIKCICLEALCPENYYDEELVMNYNYNNNVTEKLCVLKYNSSKYENFKVLVITPESNIQNFSNYDLIFHNLITAFQEIHKIMIINNNGSIELDLENGIHDFLRKDLKIINEMFFRTSFFSLKIKSINNNPVIIKLKTNQFIIYISKFLCVENIIFDGNDISFIENSKFTNEKYEFFSVDQINSKFVIINCSFINFNGFLANKKFSIFILASESNFLDLNFFNVFFDNCSFKNLITQKENVNNQFLSNSKLVFINLKINNYNIHNEIYFNIENLCLFKISSNFSEIIFINLIFYNIQSINYLFHFKNSSFTNITLKNVYLENIYNISFLYTYHTTIILIDLVINYGNFNFLNNPFFDINAGLIIIQKFIFISIESKYLNIFKIENSIIYYYSCIFSNLNINTLIYVFQSFIQLDNLFFIKIKYNINFISILGCDIVNIANVQYFNMLGENSLIYIFFVNKIIFYNSTFNQISSYFILYLESVIENKNNYVKIINNNITCFFNINPKCQVIYLNNSIIKKNIFRISFFTNFIQRIIFKIDNSLIIENNSSDFSLINIFYTEISIKTTLIKYNFLINDRLSDSILSIQDRSSVYLENSFFEDNGIPYLKRYYVALTHNALIGFYDVKIAKFYNNIFILTDLINQISGILNGLPLGDELILSNCEFILINPNPLYEYKGLMIQATKKIQFNNNFFFGMNCNKRSFQHIHGSILFQSDKSSYKYFNNTYSIEINNDSYISCNCFKGGAISILGINTISIKNCFFFNSFSSDFAGHIALLGVENIYLTNNIFNYSIANDGGSIYFLNIHNCFLINNMILNSISLKNGNLFIKNVRYLFMNFTIFSNITSFLNGGSLFIFSSNVYINSIHINSSKVELKGGIILEQFSSLSIINGTIYNSVSREGGFLYINNANKIILKYIISINVTSEKNGGLIYASLLESIIVENLQIIKNTCQQSGIIFILCDKENANFNFYNLNCYNNDAIEGNCIYFISNSKIILSNIKCLDNNGTSLSFYWSILVNIKLYFISIQNSITKSSFIVISGINLILDRFEIFNCFSFKYIIDGEISDLIINNLISKNITGIYYLKIIYSILLIQNINILKNNNNSCSFINSFHSKIAINNALIINTKYYPIINVMVGEIIIENSSFLYNYIISLVLYFCDLQLKNTNFNNSNIEYPPNDIKFDENFLDFHSIIIRNCFFTGNSIELKGNINIEIFSTLFLNYHLNQFVFAILFENILNLLINNSKFENFTDSAIKLFSSNKIYNPILIFKNNFFLKNKGTCGGTIYSQGNFSLNLTKNIFQNNKAQLNLNNKCSGIGGVLYFENMDNHNKLFLIENKFEFNYAEKEGPNCFSFANTISNSNIFKENYDGNNFTQELFSFPIKLIVLNKFPIEITSGKFFDLSLAITDYFNQTLNFENKAVLIIKSIENYNLNIIILNSIGVIKNGMITFKSLKINLISGIRFNLTIEGDFIYLKKIKRISLILEFSSNKCGIGSIISFDFSCIECSQGFYSFLDPSKYSPGSLSCNYCPINSYCFGKYFVYPKQGYYRMFNESINAIECNNFYSCEGFSLINSEISYYDYNKNFMGKCKEGNYGYLCFNCEKSYGKFNEKDPCIKCVENNALNYIRIIGILIFLMYLIVSAGKTKHKSAQSYQNILEKLRGVIKAIIGHNQQIIIIIGGNIKSFSVFSLKDFLQILGSISFLNENAINNDCIFNIDTNKNEIMIIKKLLILLLPILCTILAIIFQDIFLQSIIIIFAGLKNKIRIIFSNIFLNLQFYLIFSLYLCYPLILKSSFDLINCVKLDPDNDLLYLKIDPNIRCDNYQYYEFLLIIGFPGIVCIGIGYPIFLYFVLKSIDNLKSKTKNTIATKSKFIKVSKVKMNFEKENERKISKFAIFHKHLNPKCIYWQSNILIRKFLLTFFATLNNQIISEEIQYFCILIICYLSILQIYYSKPFKYIKETNIEIFSLIICLFTCLFVLISNSVCNKNIILVTTILFFILNLLFFLYLLHLIFFLLKALYRQLKMNRKMGKIFAISLEEFLQ